MHTVIYGAFLREKLKRCRYPERPYCLDCTDCYPFLIDLSNRRVLDEMVEDYRLAYGHNSARVEEFLRQWKEGVTVEALRQNISKINRAKKALNRTEEPDKFSGIEALGVLMADVDNLGLVFSCGLKRKSLSRLATLSRQMNHFFAVYLPHILSTEPRFGDIYTVFAGGDDLFLIGPWNRIIDFALFLNDAFKKYVCRNSTITISAGISLSKPNEPIPAVSERTKEALGKAKQNEKEKDSLTVFGETVKWKEFMDLNDIKKTMEIWKEKRWINSAMLYRLDAFSAMAKQEKEILGLNGDIDRGDWECLSWRAKFKYTLARNIGKDIRGTERDEAIREVERAAGWLTTYGGKMKIPIWQIIYNQR